VKNHTLLSHPQTLSLEVHVTDGFHDTSATQRLVFKHFVEASDDGGFGLICPEFLLDVAENDNTSRSLIFIPVFGDKIDHDVSYHIKNTKFNQHFTIDRFSGVISTTGLPIDRESLDSGKLLY